MPERKSQPRKTTNTPLKYITKTLDKKRLNNFAYTRDRMYLLYIQNPKLFELVFDRMGLVGSKLISVNYSKRIPALRIIVDKLPSSKSEGRIDVFHIPMVGTVLVTFVSENSANKRITQKHEDDHIINTLYLNKKTTPIEYYENVSLKEFKSHLFNEIISRFGEQKPDWETTLLYIAPYVEILQDRGTFTKNQIQRIINKFVAEFGDIINALDFAKEKLPKIVILRILRASTFDNIIKNLERAIAQERYV